MWGYKFEKGEAQDKRLRPQPIRCPRCGGVVDKCL